METAAEFWRRCSTCKKPIPFKARYYVCSVSTCNKKRLEWVFCSMPCWDAHVPIMNHRNAWAEERTAPSRQEWERERAAEAAGSSPSPARPSSPPAASSPASVRPSNPPATSTSRPSSSPITPAPASNVVIRRSGADPSTSARVPVEAESREEGDAASDEILVVASKLKAYVRAKSGMNTSDRVLEVLSDRLRALCDQAIDVARQEGRKTVLDRDFE